MYPEFTFAEDSVTVNYRRYNLIEGVGELPGDGWELWEVETSYTYGFAVARIL